jgi:ATP-dependent DNA helicase RecG
VIRSSTRSAVATPADPLATALSSLRGVGPRRAADLARAGLGTVEDLLCRFPLRYEDRRRARPIASVTAGEVVALVGRVLRAGMRPTRRPGFTVFELLVGDDSGRLPIVWFNQRFLRDVLVVGQVVALYGKVETRGLSGLQMTSPQYEVLAGADGLHGDGPAPSLHSGRVVPVYERIGTLTPKVQRALVAAAVSHLPADEDELLPAELLARLGLPARRQAFADTHFPPARGGARCCRSS